jgi:transcriptional regulator GlxA family with amidase domain
VARVAAGSGLGSASSLRAHLGATLGMSPLAYRRQWVAPAPSEDFTRTGGGRSARP